MIQVKKMCSYEIMKLFLHSGIFYSAEEKQPGVHFARLSSCNNDSQLVDGSKVFTFWPM